MPNIHMRHMSAYTTHIIIVSPRMFIAPLFVTAPNWKPSNHLSVSKLWLY